MKKVLGYLIKESCHSFNEAIEEQFRSGPGLYKSKNAALKDIEYFKQHGAISKKSKPKVLLVTVDVVEEV